MKLLLKFVLLINWVACGSTEPSKQDIYVSPNAVSGKTEYLATPKPKVDSVLIKALYRTHGLSRKEKVALGFLKWYINEKKENDRLGLNKEIDSNGVPVLNGDAFLNVLEQSRLVSKRFIEIQNEKLERCNMMLKKQHNRNDSSHHFCGNDIVDCNFDWLGNNMLNTNVSFCGVVDTNYLGGPDKSVLITLNAGTHDRALTKCKILIVEDKKRLLIGNIRHTELIY